MRLKVVRVVTDPQICESCPLSSCRHQNAEYPQLVGCTKDECGDFVVAPNGAFWPTDEFFAMNQLRSIAVDPKELLPKGRPDSFWGPALVDPQNPETPTPRN
jgi:hypothetical protein